ncbi:UGSC family (seleno)protein [Chelativorans alearense]|uniref:UGSC family (seleno)protein n=1 Tax=Chelativorans alearense TaxID=2681495 RepID=UPI0013D72BA2|nr:hypothetical protein [Chelativorans alearense]
MKQPEYEVVWPLGPTVGIEKSTADGLPNLNGKTVVEVWDGVFRGDEVFPILREELRKAFPEVKIVPFETMGIPYGDIKQYVAKLPDRLREQGADAVIVGVGACGGCTPKVMWMSMAAEQAGIPAVSIIATGFLAQARTFARGLGGEDTPLAEYPGVPMVDSAEALRQKVISTIAPKAIEGLCSRGETGDAGDGEPNRSDIVYRGSLDGVHEFFEEKEWSDGLPIIPPTRDRVEEFLRFTDRAPDEVLGVCYPESREATVWNIAVNGVMAGCRPEYMPVLLAVVEAMIDPTFKMELGGTTPGWEPLVIINGPIVKELDFNYGSGVMRVGRRANTSIGRFVRLYMRNLSGLRIHAHGGEGGGTDKGTIGMSFNMVLAENEDAVRDIGWQPFSADCGFEAGENVVTVQSCMSMTQPVYTGGKKAIEHMEIIFDVIGEAMKYRSWGYIRDRTAYPMIVMSPSVARAFAEDGWSKLDIKTYLYEKTLIPAGLAERYAHANGVNHYSIKDYVERGLTPREYYESDDPNRLVRCLVEPEQIGIVISGDPGRNQTRGYPQNSKIGIPVSKRIELPRNWALRAA